MPTKGEQIGLNTEWFREVLAEAVEVEYADTKLKIVSPVGLLVTKYLTFTERGENDYYASHDLEDIITVIDGREGIVSEINEASDDLRNYLVAGVRELLKSRDFLEALPGHLPPDSASQLRLPQLREKLKKIAAL
jgi:predicted nucleotidyltransferase